MSAGGPERVKTWRKFGGVGARFRRCDGESLKAYAEKASGAKVFAPAVADDGKLDGSTAMPSLPADQIDVSWGDGHLEGAAWGLVGDVALLTGPKRVFSTRLVGRPCGN